MQRLDNIKYYLVSIFALLFFLFANPTVFANEYGQQHHNDILQTGISVENVNLFRAEIGQNEIENGVSLKSELGLDCENVLKVLSNAAESSRSIVSLTEETFSQAMFNGAENIGGYSIYGTKGMVGSTFNRNVFLLEASNKSLSGFRSLIGTMESEAVGLGANKISIYGSSVINKGFLNPNIATRFGYSFQQSGRGVLLQKTLIH